MVQGKFKTHSYVQKRQPESDWIIVEDTHDGIISRDLFTKVQELRGWAAMQPDSAGQADDTLQAAKPCDPNTLQKPKRKRGFSSRSAENIFFRKVYCGHCGYTMLRHRSSETQYRFYCPTRQRLDKSVCVNTGINENVMKKMLLSILEEHRGQFDAAAVISGAAQADVIEDSELRAVQADIKKNSRFLEGLYESLVSGIITNDEFKELKGAYETKIAALNENEKRLRDVTYGRTRQQAELSKARGIMQAMRNITDLTAEIVISLIERIRVFKDKSIRVNFTFADEEISSDDFSCEGKAI